MQSKFRLCLFHTYNHWILSMSLLLFVFINIHNNIEEWHIIDLDKIDKSRLSVIQPIFFVFKGVDYNE